MFVRVNVKSLMVIYFVPINEGQATAELKEKLKVCFNTSKSLGYTIFYNYVSMAELDKLPYTEIIVIKKLDENFSGQTH